MKFIYSYIIFINLLLFFIMFIDKQKSKLNKWRISEKTLFILAFIGGSIGGILGMYTFRHKTKHFKFKLGFPIIALFQFITILLYFIHKFNI